MAGHGFFVRRWCQESRKSAMNGKLPLMPAIKQLMDEVMAGPLAKEELDGPLAEEFALLASAKKLALFAAGAATQKYMQQLQDQQVVVVTWQSGQPALIERRGQAARVVW